MNDRDKIIYKKVILKAMELNGDKNKRDEARKEDLKKYIKSFYSLREEN
ncbi:hypothetical protein R2F61_02515 [Mollicutes bacterium LVI A0078]|nr:hypothetical protein RZE84_02545 [Mollicutes bacterium LVI A0075]WOO91443.1 hypothetical protein R2F61_02515 [Mollicutes bacterium LVI A0078]